MVKYKRLRRELNIHLNNGHDPEYAVLTHFLSTHGEPAAKNYLDGAASAIRSLLPEEVLQHPLPDGQNDSPSVRWLRTKLPVQWNIPFPPPQNPSFTFVDLFAGIGGMRIPFQDLGGLCVFSSEINGFARAVYEANFGQVPFGDITKISTDSIPNHDILLAGFPCQAFSIIGKRAGFEDETHGTLFYEIRRILLAKRPKAFLLENVEGLKSHDKGNTLRVILEVLRNELGYFVPEPQILNAKNFGVPQSRKRIFIVGFRPDLSINEVTYPSGRRSTRKIASIRERNSVPAKYFMSQGYLDTLKRHREREREKGNDFGYVILDNNGIANALVGGGSGRERNLLQDNRPPGNALVNGKRSPINSEGIRMMTPREWARLQGFIGTFQFDGIVSDTQAYKQFANSVAIPVIYSLGEEVLNRLDIPVRPNRKRKNV